MISVYGTPDIKVITGVRRSGKSKLLEAFHQYLLKEHPDVNVIHINLMLTEYEDLLEYHALNNYENRIILMEKKIRYIYYCFQRFFT